jgi:hypothetical protein
MPWVNHHTFKNDRKVRRAALLATYTAGFDAPTHYLTLFGVWAHIRKQKSSMQGYMSWRELLHAELLCGEDVAPGSALYAVRMIHTQTMRGSDMGKQDQVMGHAKNVRTLNVALKTFGTQLPKGVALSLSSGTVGINSHYLDPFFNHMHINQGLQAAFLRANSVGDGSFIPDKRFLMGQLEGNPGGMYAYSNLYKFCKGAGFDPEMVGVMDVGNVPKPKSQPTQNTSQGWIPGIAPRM